MIITELSMNLTKRQLSITFKNFGPIFFEITNL